MAKGIGNGAPLAAVVTTPKIAAVLAQKVHFNTFGGNPVVSAIGKAVLEVIEQEKTQENCHRLGTYILAGLERLRAKHKVIGDIRGGFFGSRTENRNTAVTQVRDVRARVRIGLENAFNKEWRGTVRFAGHYSEEEASRRFSLHTYNDSRAFGQSTLDIANVEYLPNTRWNITAGRMQTKFELEGVAKKSLDRNDSPNIDIDFTDGLRAVRKADGGWHWTGIVQHNPVRGSTNVTRLPLNFGFLYHLP